MIYGYIPTTDLELWIKSLNSDDFDSINLNFDINSDLNKNLLLKNSMIANYGLNSIRVHDPTIRNAFKIDKNNFYLDLNLNSIKNDIKNKLFPELLKFKHTIKLKKKQINIYQIGGHFQNHLDKSKYSDSIGTLILLLPFTFTGGELCCKYHMANYQWCPISNNIEWICFKHDTNHAVNPIISGLRVTITYDIILIYNNTQILAPNLKSSNELVDISIHKKFQDVQILQQTPYNPKFNFAPNPIISAFNASNAPNAPYQSYKSIWYEFPKISKNKGISQAFD
jgi:hypothetical protein